MEHIVYYFSGTGNSLHVAKLLETMGAEVHSIATELHLMKQNGVGSINCDADKVGFIVPLYYLGLPRLVHEFLEVVELNSNAYVYLITTMGWTLRGGAIRQMKQHLIKKNVVLALGEYIHMPMNDFTLVSVDKPEKQAKVLSKYEQRIKKVLEWIKEEKKHTSLEPLGILADNRNEPFCENTYEEDKNYSVSTDCNGCEICSRVCPVENITIYEQKPKWEHKCQTCLACFHYCPKQAILYKGKSKEIPHYHHPDISVTELIRYNKR